MPFASLHGHPEQEFPYFLGYEEECGEGAGVRIGAPGRPTLFVMEGGYAGAEIGVNAANVLSGFEGG